MMAVKPKHVAANLDIWLAVHHSITFLLLPTWYTNFLFIHTNYIKLIPLHVSSAIRSLSGGQRCKLYICSLWYRHSLQVTVLCNRLAVAQDGHLQRVKIPEAAYVQFASLTTWWWTDCARNMQRNLILCNLCEWTRN